MSVRQALIAWRAKRGLKQADAATAVGIDRSAYSRMENGARGLEIEEAERLADALGMRLVLVGHEQEHIATLIGLLTPQQLDLATRIVALIPRLDPADLRTLMALIDVWGGSSRSDQEPIVEGKRASNL